MSATLKPLTWALLRARTARSGPLRPSGRSGAVSCVLRRGRAGPGSMSPRPRRAFPLTLPRSATCPGRTGWSFPRLRPRPTPAPRPAVLDLRSFEPGPAPAPSPAPEFAREPLSFWAGRGIDPVSLSCRDRYREMLIAHGGRTPFGPEVAQSLSEELLSNRPECLEEGWSPEFGLERVCVRDTVGGVRIRPGLIHSAGVWSPAQAVGTGRDGAGTSSSISRSCR